MATVKELQAELATARAERDAAVELAKVASKPRSLSLKVGAKGGMSLYGLNARFPVTLYKAQWARLFEFVPTMQQFVIDHADELTEKSAVAASHKASGANVG
jgi:hypothetical protein